MSIFKIRQIPATPKQKEYIEQLAIDLQIHSRDRLYPHINEVLKLPPDTIKFLDELTKDAASRVIEKLKGWKENGIV